MSIINDEKMEKLTNENKELKRHIQKLKECYEKWKNPNVSYIAFLNRVENQRGNEAWETIEKIMKDMER